MSNLSKSKYVQYLPLVYQKGYEESEEKLFLDNFLSAFEEVLSGKSDESGEETIGIESMLNRFDLYFDPHTAPAQFLTWLAGWLGLELQDGLEFYGEEDNVAKNTAPIQILPLAVKRHSVNRDLISKAVGLYKKRSTAVGLKEHLEVYVGEEATLDINEFEEQGRIGSQNCIGKNTVVGYGSPCFFSVHLTLPIHNKTMLNQKVSIVKNIIEGEKPFYANYILNVQVPRLCLGVSSALGKETLLGGMVLE